MLPFTVVADACRLETPGAVNRVRGLIAAETLIVHYCWFCERSEPEPLRVRSVGFQHTEPAQVRVTVWSENPPGERVFPLAALQQAERDGSGPLARFVREDIEKTTDTSGYLGPDDPYLLEEKRAQFLMRLRFAREEHAQRVWDQLTLNGQAADPRQLYVPAGGDRYRSVGWQVGCDMDSAPRSITFRPVARDPEREVPPVPFIADVTGQCYDGACPRSVWRVRQGTPLFDRAEEKARQIALLEPNEVVTPLTTLSHVVGSRVEVQRDHGRFFAGDVCYLLDSQAEGFYRIWHYGDVLVIDASGIQLDAARGSCSGDPAGCWARGAGYPQELWWSRVRRANGDEGWVRDPAGRLDGVLESD